jgi:hypothetical protein
MSATYSLFHQLATGNYETVGIARQDFTWVGRGGDVLRV